MVVDDRGQIRFTNETCRQMFGHSPESLVGRPLDLLVPERLRGRHREHVVNFMSEPNNREMAARTGDLFALRADGSEFSAGIRLAPFRMGDQQLVAVAVRDMTERRRITDELLGAREEADRANRAKSRFLATASHDLRQPMQTICLPNAALLRVAAQPEIRELLQNQSQAIDSMARLLNALLDISRLESGAVEPVVSNWIARALAMDSKSKRCRSTALRWRFRRIERSSASCWRTCWGMRSSTRTAGLSA